MSACNGIDIYSRDHIFNFIAIMETLPRSIEKAVERFLLGNVV